VAHNDSQWLRTIIIHFNISDNGIREMQAATSVLSRLRVGLGTLVAIDAEADDGETSARALEAAFQAMLSVEHLMHPTRNGSDVARLSAFPHGLVTVHPWTFEVLELCVQLNGLSDGVFDPCLPASSGRMRDIELIGDAGVVVHAPIQLDLGGVAKGYAVDRAVEALRAEGCEAGLVNAGGDLAVFGPLPRRIVCRGLDTGPVIELREAALATSVVCAAARPPEHRGHYHGVSGASASRGSVCVIAASAAAADALTKCLLWCDRATGEEILAHFDARRLDA
jgi:thiamine biosynthesis lipoprotein